MSASPTFSELFPTHLRGAGVGFSVAVGRIGAAFGVLLVTTIGTPNAHLQDHPDQPIRLLARVALLIAATQLRGAERMRGASPVDERLGLERRPVPSPPFVDV